MQFSTLLAAALASVAVASPVADSGVDAFKNLAKRVRAAPS